MDDLGRLRLWDADTGEPLAASPTAEPVFLARFLDANRLVLAALSGPVRLWELPLARGSVAELGDLARLAAGHEIDVAGGLSFIPPARQFGIFSQLQAHSPSDFLMPQFEAAWHRQEARRAAAAGDVHARRFHRQALTRKAPATPSE